MKPSIEDLNLIASFAKDIMGYFGNHFQYAETGPQIMDTPLSTKQYYKGRRVEGNSEFTISVKGEWSWYACLKIGGDFEKEIEFESADIEEVKQKIDSEIFREMPLDHDRAIVKESFINERMKELAGVEN